MSEGPDAGNARVIAAKARKGRMLENPSIMEGRIPSDIHVVENAIFLSGNLAFPSHDRPGAMFLSPLIPNVQISYVWCAGAVPRVRHVTRRRETFDPGG